MVLASATELAHSSGIVSQFPNRRPHKISRRLDSGQNETILSASDEVKREMMEVVNTALSELKARFCDDASVLARCMNWRMIWQMVYECEYND